ncbi:MAG TPA: spermidine/putrescine ABC transporter substrate-binding protein [Solirubrobacterales bacterium]|nr:spermidine/putrescine ABC transporter substrate-binding protein [Solirubrobacterales bacterium]
MRAIVWPGMPDGLGLERAAAAIGRPLEIEVISSNEDLELLMDDGRPCDLIFPSDYLVEKLVAEGRLRDISGDRRIDRDLLAEWCRHPAYDPDERFAIPFAFGLTGLLHDGSVSPSSWSDFFDPEGGVKVGLLDEVREVLGAALILAGRSPNRMDGESLAEAARILRRQRPAVASRSSDDFTGPVERGEVSMHLAWSGPASMAIHRSPGLRFTVPREGALLWVTTASVPAGAPDPDASVELIAALMEPGIAALAVENGGYSSPNTAARDLLRDELREDPVLFPPVEQIRRCQTTTSLSAAEERAMLDLWELETT